MSPSMVIHQSGMSPTGPGRAPSTNSPASHWAEVVAAPGCRGSAATAAGAEEAGDADTGQDERGKSSGGTDHEGSFETSPRCGARPGPDTEVVRIVPG